MKKRSMRRARVVLARRWEAGQRPGQNSLRLLPSGPDRVGETPVHRQPPEGTISGRGPSDARPRACPIAWCRASVRWSMKPPNFYAANGLDRAGHRRREPDWLKTRLAHPETLFVPVWRGQNLVTSVGEAAPAAIMVRRESLVSLEGDPVLLGLREERAYFALDFSRHEAPLQLIRADAPAEFTDLRRVGPLLAPPDGALLAYARGILYWHGRHRFCGVCGNATQSEEGGHV